MLCPRLRGDTVSPLIGWPSQAFAFGFPILERAGFKAQIERLAIRAERLDRRNIQALGAAGTGNHVIGGRLGSAQVGEQHFAKLDFCRALRGFDLESQHAAGLGRSWPDDRRAKKRARR